MGDRAVEAAAVALRPGLWRDDDLTPTERAEQPRRREWAVEDATKAIIAFLEASDPPPGVDAVTWCKLAARRLREPSHGE